MTIDIGYDDRVKIIGGVIAGLFDQLVETAGIEETRASARLRVIEQMIYCLVAEGFPPDQIKAFTNRTIFDARTIERK
jgi:hypothetical protein